MAEDVLVVDDDEDTRVLVAEALRRRGYRVEAFDSGAACLERLARTPAAVVITDIEMPEMTGLELCATVRRQHAEVLVIVISGLKSPDTAVAARAAGANEFLGKPVRIAALETAIRTLPRR